MRGFGYLSSLPPSIIPSYPPSCFTSHLSCSYRSRSSLHHLRITDLIAQNIVHLSKEHNTETGENGFNDIPRGDIGHFDTTGWRLPSFWLWGGILDRLVADHVWIHSWYGIRPLCPGRKATNNLEEESGDMKRI
ncbi:unnamed protein product [Linum tenue]|uniref:Uncharacterized protein n=1 Tax=Linum tenue TaxID=586396 RepID=A0AAV0IAL8_9ROSI|nr:unnamed protein product [Linum tenue]